MSDFYKNENLSGTEREYPGSALDKKRKRKAQIRRRVALILALLLVAAAAVGIAVFMPSRKHIAPEQYFAQKMLESAQENGAQEAGSQEEGSQGESGQEEGGQAEGVPQEGQAALAQALAGEAAAVVLEDTVDARRALMREDQLYLNYEMVYEVLNSRFFWDEESQTMLFTTPLELYVFTPDSLSYTVGDEEKKADVPPVIRAEEELYISADLVQQFTNVEYITGEDSAHVRIDYRWEPVRVSNARRKTALRVSPDIKADIAQDLPEGAEVTVLEENGKWMRVVSGDGFIGYVKSRHLEAASEKEKSRAFDEPEYTSLHLDEKVRLVWHAMDTAEVNQYLDHDTKSMTGINVISPTWFALSDNDGHFTSCADSKYVRRAHRKGLQVWALLSNFNSEVSTYEVVSRASSRRTLEEELVAQVLEHDIDGINIDLEAITADSAPGYVQLLRELSILCRKNEIILSVDVPVPMPFNEYYDRAELGTVTDYVIMMGYDEHYYGSEAGSVASLPFEENGIRESLELIPADKLVSGIPFYTRVWYSWQEADGSEGLTSEVISMYAARDYLEGSTVETVWLEEQGQNYAEWTDESGTLCRIWLEDERSIALKAELVNTYKLGGFGAWVLGNEMDEIWAVLEETVKE